MHASLFWHEEWLIFSMMRAGLLSLAPMVRNIECVTAITSAEGTPLPLTSPMQKYNLSSLTK